MKKTALGLLLTLIMIFSTSCQPINQAIEDTFRETVPRKESKDEEESSLKKFSRIFIDQSNYPLPSEDFIGDAEDKAGFEFSQDLKSYITSYMWENDINRYLTEDEIFDLIEKKEAHDFLMHPEKVEKIVDDFLKEKGWDDASLYYGKFSIFSSYFYFDLINPEDPKDIATYYYSHENKEWTKTPFENFTPEQSLEKLSLKTYPWESLNKIMEVAKDCLRDMGDYRDYDITSDPWFGINYISSTSYVGEDPAFNITVIGKDKEVYMVFDMEGNLISKEER